MTGIVLMWGAITKRLLEIKIIRNTYNCFILHSPWRYRFLRHSWINQCWTQVSWHYYTAICGWFLLIKSNHKTAIPLLQILWVNFTFCVCVCVCVFLLPTIKPLCNSIDVKFKRPSCEFFFCLLPATKHFSSWANFAWKWSELSSRQIPV